MPLDKRTIIIIASVIGVIMITLGIVGLAMQGGQKTEGENETKYVDPGSGETIIDSDKAPQGTELSLRNAIIYPGFSKLIDRGLSPEQVQAVQAVIADYSLKQEDKFKEVSLTTSSMRHILPQGNSTTHTISFDIVVDRETDYFVTVDYDDTTTSTTKLYNSDRKTLLAEV